MLKHEARPGDNVTDAAQQMARLAKKKGQPVSCNFNDIELVCQPGESGEAVAQRYVEELERRSEAYRASPEYKQRKLEAEQRDREKALLRELVLVGVPEKITLSDPVIWQSWLDSNTDEYGGRVCSYADEWGRMMEGQIAKGKTLEQCAEETSLAADYDGITGFMYGAAVDMLSKAWIHGEQLRKWHNLKTQIGNEGEKANESGGVLNPALLNIG